MKYLSILVSFLVASYTISAQNVAQQLSTYDESNRPEVMVIGTFHFAEYSGDDSGNTYTGTPPDVMTDQRQAELAKFRDQLAAFKPTKICIERHIDTQTEVSDRYQSYLTSTESKETRNETFQIAFKLAKQLQHTDVYAVDAENDWFMDSLATYAMTNGQGEFLMKANKFIPTWINDSYKAMQSKTISQILLDENTPEALRISHAFHLQLNTIGKTDTYIGTDLYSSWMRRNTKIFTHINRLAEPNDRILVLYGASHAHSIKTMLKDSFDFDLIELDQYVQANN